MEPLMSKTNLMRLGLSLRVFSDAFQCLTWNCPILHLRAPLFWLFHTTPFVNSRFTSKALRETRVVEFTVSLAFDPNLGRQLE